MKVKKYLISLILVISVTCGVGLGVFAAQLKDGAAFHNGGLTISVVSNIKYWEQDTKMQSYGLIGYSSTARTDYDNISNANIGFTRVSTESSADVRVYTGYYYESTWYGKIQPYAADGTPITISDNSSNDPSTTWSKVNLALNQNELKNLSEYQKQKTVVHEWGHVLGLKHQSWWAGSVMEQGTVDENGSVDYRHPTQLDISNLQWKY